VKNILTTSDRLKTKRISILLLFCIVSLINPGLTNSLLKKVCMGSRSDDDVIDEYLCCVSCAYTVVLPLVHDAHE